MASFAEDVNSTLGEISSSHKADFLIYAGQINRQGADQVLRALRQKRHPNLIMLLCTTGGDSHAAFKIARACQTTYSTVSQGYKQPNQPNWSIYIPTVCKSAGTILAIGADQLMMGLNAELGPIDIQTTKPGEVGELTSTLTPVQAVPSLQRQMSDVFVHIFTSLRFNEKVSFSTKMAGEFAKDMSASIIGPIAQQIDPMRLAETERLLKISSEYGERLNDGVGNLKDDALPKLLSSYPSHGFVIDRREAESLFHKVAAPSDPVFRLGSRLYFVYGTAAGQEDAVVHMVTPIAQEEADVQENQEPIGPTENDGQSVGTDGEGRSQIRQANERRDGPRTSEGQPPKS